MIIRWRRLALPLQIAGAVAGLSLALAAARGARVRAQEPIPPAAAALSPDAPQEVARPSSLTVADLPPYSPEYGDGASILRRLELHTTIPERPRLTVQTYRVKKGDTLFGIAQKFGLKPESLLWGNFEVLGDDPHSLRPEQELNILPVDGTYYQWNEGDHLEAVAAFFGTTAGEIRDWPGNALSPLDPTLEAGTWLIIPGGRREFVTWQAPRITRANPAVARIAGPGACGAVYDGPIGEGYFNWPTTAGFLSGYGYSSFHPGIDIAGSLGNAIYASASGVVVYAGWNNYGYGSMVVIDHGDGWQTLYAHMNQVSVGCGEGVYQGYFLGGVGNSGNSSGPHLHFEMQSDTYGKVNPADFTSPRSQ